MTKKIKIAINGLGRIGKLVVRAVFERNLQNAIDIVFINSPSSIKNKKYSIKYDTVHGTMHQDISIMNDNIINIQGMSIKTFDHKNIDALDCSNIDIVFECSGKMKNHGMEFIKKGAQYVLISAPADNVDQTIVYGVSNINRDARVFSMGSCTTNAFAVLLDMIMQEYKGIIACHMVTVHAYTNDQRILDGSHNDLYRGRAAASSIVPTTTGAQSTIKKIFPELLNSKITCAAYRVPTANVSLIDLHIVLDKYVDKDTVNALAKKYAKNSNVMSINDEKLVSSDFNHNPSSCVFDTNITATEEGAFLHIGGWYDNEWGFANRMIDAALDIMGHM